MDMMDIGKIRLVVNYPALRSTPSLGPLCRRNVLRASVLIRCVNLVKYVKSPNADSAQSTLLLRSSLCKTYLYSSTKSACAITTRIPN